MSKLKISSTRAIDAEGLLKHQTMLKSKECSLCHYSTSLRDQFLFPVASSGVGRILVVGYQSFIEEHKNTIAMSGPFRGTFNSYLNKYTGLSEIDCTFTYSVKCTNGEGSVNPKAQELKNCSRYLLQEVGKLNPVITLFLGKDSAKSLLSTKVRQKYDMGVPFKEKILGKDQWCMFILNPMVSRTKTGAGPIVEAHFKALSLFLEQNTTIYNHIVKPKVGSLPLVQGVREYILVDTAEKLQAMQEDLKQYTLIGMDTETNTLNTYSKDYRLVGLSLAGSESRGYYIPIAHKALGRKKYLQLNWDIIKPVVTTIVRDPKVQTIWHNLYFDYAAMKQAGVDIFKLDPPSGVWTHDSMLMTYLLDENSKLGLKDQMYLHFNTSPEKFKDVVSGGNVKTFADIDPNGALKYAADDAINCLLLFNKVVKKVKYESKQYTKNQLLNRIYPDELNTIRILSEAHLLGIRIDNNYLTTLTNSIHGDIDETKKAVFAISTIVSNLSSGPKLVSAIESILTVEFLDKFLVKFDKLTAQERMLHVLIEGYTKYWDRAELGIDSEYPGKWHPDKLSSYINLVIRYKHLLKMKSTYIEAIDSLKEQDAEGNWIVHAQIKSIGTTSGRMSSRNPNLQNIPRSVPQAPDQCGKCETLFKDDISLFTDRYISDTTLSRYTCNSCGYINKTYVYDLRRLYIPRPGKKFIAADYRNMELYLAAAVSGCQELYDVFLKKELNSEDPNGDMHVVTASAILGITPDEWKQKIDSGKHELIASAKEARTIAKTVNFLTLYGGSAEGLYKTFLNMGMDKTKAECQQYIDAFFSAYPALKEWFNTQRYNIITYGRLVNNYGRIRHILKQGGEMLSAINMLIQGLGAQVVKESIVNIYDKWQTKEDWNLLLVIHDENIFEVPEVYLEDALSDITDIMQVTIHDALDVNLRIDSILGMSSLSKADKGLVV